MAQERSPSSAGLAGSDKYRETTIGGLESSDASQTSGGIVDRVRERASAGLTTQKDRAMDGLGTVAQAVRQTTQQLRDQRQDIVARYADQAADQIERFSNALRQKDVGELIEDAQRLARRQPALFIGSAFALGLVSARFLKSSRPDSGAAYSTGSSRRTGGSSSGVPDTLATVNRPQTSEERFNG
jgi:hypothetical protein